MDAARWALVKRAFAQVQEADAADRPALLASLDDDVRAEVASLVAALETAPPLVSDARESRLTADTMIGPYRILGELGRGGMGTVYRAVRADGELSRHLALKVAGDRIFAPEAERRFIQERNILAGLDHPNIVRLLDGGVSDGRRYFVMELAEGTPITSYSAGRRLPIRARVGLFRQVLAAIHAAHQHLVLHRDIKPGNVIVLPDGQVKVLDFGIAQIVRAGTPAADTRTILHPLSFACASPEQLRGQPLALTSDIYALGTLLYEVLTGTNPQYRPDLSMEEALRLVLEEDPPRPSRLSRAVPRDLDAVVLKALAKAPADRYQSVSELDADLGRWLDHRPVTAVPPRPWYVFTRFVRRNKALTATAAALLVSLVAGAAVATRQARAAERRFEDARQLVHAVVFDIQPKMESIPATLPLRRTLIENTLRYLEAVSRDAGNNVALLTELANSYAQLGVIQGDALAAHLGDRKAAAAHYEQASRLMDRARALAPASAALLADASNLHRRRSDFALQNEDREAAAREAEAAVQRAEEGLALEPALAAALEARASALFAHGRAVMAREPDVALARFEQARAFYAAPRPEGAVPPREAGLVELYTSDIYIKRGDGERGPRHAEASLAIARQILAARPDDQTARLDVTVAEGQLAAGLWNAGRQAEAIEHFKAVADMREQILAADPDNVRARERVALARGRLGTILAGAGDLPGARVNIERSLAIYEGLRATGQLATTMEGDVAEVQGHLGDYHRRTGNARESCAAYRRAIDGLEALRQRGALTPTREAHQRIYLDQIKTCR